MNEIPTIAEKLVAYYNDLIKNNVIAGEAPVTLEWLRKQRIVEGRGELDIRFGHVTVDNILGEKTPLAKAEQYLNFVQKYDEYDLLTTIASLLVEECTTMLQPDNSIREKYSSLYKEITISTTEIKSEEFSLPDIFPIIYKKISILEVHRLNNFLKSLDEDYFLKTGYSNAYFLIYIRECIYDALVIAFREIKKEVETVVK